MVKININISEEMFAAMKRYPEIDWNKVMIDGFIEHLDMLESLPQINKAKKELKEGKGIRDSDLKKN